MARLLVLGSSNTDMTVRLPRLPLPGQTVLGGSLLTGPGGKGANQAVAAARAGGEVVFVTAVGDDTFGKRALDGYRREGIDVSHALIREGTPSGVALIFVDDHGENMIGVASGANASIDEADIDRLPDEVFEPGGWLLVAGLEIPIAAVRRALERASDRGMKVILNPAPCPGEGLPLEIFKGIDIITPNRIELGQLTGIDTGTQAGTSKAARELWSRSHRMAVVVTLGGDGCYVEEGTSNLWMRAYPVEVVDTVGAGDAFNGALAVALAEGRLLCGVYYYGTLRTPPEPLGAVHWATAAAALAVTRPGAQSALPPRAEIDRLASQRLPEFTDSEIQEWSEAWRL